MITALIVEDERLSAERLHGLIKKVNPNIQVLGVCDSVSTSKQWLRDESQPDVVFLDIQLNDGTGFDILQDLELTCPIVFTTAYDEYAIKAFQYNSIDYLLKPIAEKDLIRAINKLQNQPDSSNNIVSNNKIDTLERLLSGDFKKRFLVKLGEQFKTINIEEVAYFYYDDGLTYLMSISGKKWPLDMSLDQLETKVSPLQFFRINRKIIIALPAINEIHTYFNSRLLLKLRQGDPQQPTRAEVSLH